MSRLPTPGQDSGNWGEILNDFLEQAHNDDGTLKESAISSKEDSSNKSTDITTDATSDDKYPSVKAVKTYADNKVTEVVDTTSVTGLLKGNGSIIAQAIEGVDYLSPVASPTTDNFASLSATGTIIDSGHKHEDYALTARGLPAGGTTGQALIKSSATDYALEWAAVGRSNANLLINWDFRTPVNQRGVASFSNGQYGIDMWLLGTGSASVSASGLTLSDGYIIQRFETARESRIYTISIMVEKVVHSGQLTFAGNDTAAVALGTSGVAAQLVANNNGCNGLVIGAGSASVIIEAVKMEIGTVSTLAYDPPIDYAIEILKCKRYYRKITAGGDVSGIVGNGVFTNVSNNAIILVPIGTPMRISPTLTMIAGGYLYGDGIYPAVTAMSSGGIYESALRLGCTATIDSSHWFKGCVLAGGASFELSAEL